MMGIHERSGGYTTKDPLVGFLYDLMRDHVPPGVVEKLVQEQTDCDTKMSNGWLAKYAEDLAQRLKAP